MADYINDTKRRSVVEKMWLNYHNNSLLEKALITKFQHHKENDFAEVIGNTSPGDISISDGHVVAEETGISKSALGKYEADDFKDISPFSIVTLAKYYGVSTDYLMGMTETKNHPNTDLHDLHLSGDMIALLKCGKLNTRLLCEMALHKDFQRMMVDIEIFVDRIADMRINDMNTVLNATRQQVIEKYNPGENALYVRTLELARISENDYFGHVVHEDIDCIMWDIRDAH